MSDIKSVELTARECEVIADGLQVRILKLLDLQQTFRDASPYVSGMDVAIASVVEELAFLRALLARVEGRV